MIPAQPLQGLAHVANAIIVARPTKWGNLQAVGQIVMDGAGKRVAGARSGHPVELHPRIA